MLSNRPRNPEFERKLSQMRLPLAPLVQLTTGRAHPQFPPTLLHYWLLTDSTLDSLASFYHQRTPCPWTQHYPKSMNWREGLSLEEKRRKMGNFIGLRGCETPVQTRFDLGRCARGNGMDGTEAMQGVECLLQEKSEEQIYEEARRAREEAGESEAEMWRRKMGRY